jgi:Pyruvate-formate lyase
MGCITERVIKLRDSALGEEVPGIRSPEGQLLWYRGWLEGENCSSNILRRAYTKAYMLRNSTPVIGTGELIVGKPNYRVLSADEYDELEQYENYAGRAMANLQGQGSHMAIDYEKLLKLGVNGIKNEICNYRKMLHPENSEDLKKEEFYKACVIALEGVAAYASKYSDFAREEADRCKDEKRKGELLEISRILSNVPANPAASFREALQSIHFVTVCLEGLYTFGRPDRYLLPYYINDIKKGEITPEFAQELIDCLCILYNEYVPKGSAIGFMLGGKDSNGKDMTNELTYMFIESIGHTRLIFPAIGLCYNSGTPEDLLLKSMCLLGEGLSHPAIFNDEVIIKGLMQYGLPYGEACNYVHSTCVEITPVASSGVWVASPYHNLVQILLDILYIYSLGDSGSKTEAMEPCTIKNYEKFETYDDIVRACKDRLAEKIRQGVVEENLNQMGRCLYGGDPLVSCFVNDCLSRGMDIDEGGARYNWIMPSFVGLANLADSLMTIKKLVFDQKVISLQELATALENDFVGYESLRQFIINKVPRYGNDESEVDSIIGDISSWIIEEVKRYKTFHGGCFAPSLFCWIMHESFGSLTEASPDGRKRAFPLGDGSGPAQGREMKGPTASILSSTKWCHELFIGGIAVNMKFSRDYFSEENLQKIASLIKVFISRGGFELQINVVDKEVLLAARKNPGAYQDLIVRVGGYSDYFTHLSPAMQNEVILRTTHG